MRCAYGIHNYLNTKSFCRHEHVTELTKPHECIQCGYSTLRIQLIRKHVQSGGPYHTNQCTQCEGKL